MNGIRITHVGRCPICRVPVYVPGHSYCVAQLGTQIELGLIRLENWTDPLPDQFKPLRKAIFFQLARNTVAVSAVRS